MRVTLQTIHNNILNNLNTITTSMNRINTRISSGREMSKLSDHPVNLVGALGLRSNLAEIQQYRKNLLYGDTFIRGSESALTGIKDLVIRAKVLSTQAVNAPMTAANRASIAEEVRHLFEQAVILSNTQVGGKFIFGGYRTTGYTAAEPAPFIAGLMDGYRVHGNSPLFLEEKLTGTVGNTALAAGDLLINGFDIGAVDLVLPDVNGLYMQGAAAMKTAINNRTADTGVTAALTTLHAGIAAQPEDSGVDSRISFTLNGIAISVDIPDGTAAGGVTALVAQAINAVRAETGVEAEPGDGTNGGGAGVLVLRNVLPGNETAISISNLQETGNARSGLADGAYGPAGGNTGRISLGGTSTFELASDNVVDDSILALFGWQGGGIGFADQAGDGLLVYGPQLGTDSLKINGLAVPAAEADGISNVYADASAAAKAAAINQISGQTGVTATINPAYHFAMGGAVEEGVLAAGDLIINGVDIFGPGSGNLTTLHAGQPAGTPAADSEITFKLNGHTIRVEIPAGTTASEVARITVDAINEQSNTGVEAYLGNGNNGAPPEAVVFRNTRFGDMTPIVVSDYTVHAGDDVLGFGDFNAVTGRGIIAGQDSDNYLVTAINNFKELTGINASRNASGQLLLAAADGRNLQIQTSGRGERVTRLNGGTPAAPQSRVYFGSLRLHSSREFALETAAGGYEPGLAALGLADGGFEVDDTAGDGRLRIHSALIRADSVRYTGDPGNDLRIKVGASSTLAISKNGRDALLETGVFSELKKFENFLRGGSYTGVTGKIKLTDTTALLNSDDTGIEVEVTKGSFTIVITDHDHAPPRNFYFELPVDPDKDSPADVAAKLDGLPGFAASWDNGRLAIRTTDPDRYTFALKDDTSNFLEAVGLRPDDLQVDALTLSLQGLEELMEKLTSHISDFGARSNRIAAQNQILSNLELATSENLSEKQDTDIVKALMEFKNKELAYQAALSAAAKTMQLSLVNYL